MTEEEVIEKFERENISLASFPKRFFAYCIDEILVSFLFVMIYASSIETSENIEETIKIINGMFLYIIILRMIYHSFFIWMYGATLGKIFMKIKVVSTHDLENPTFIFSFSRAVIRIISESVFYLGFFWALTNPKKETWHDRVAQTLVVNVF